ncbi:esterase/lipase family protein [Lysobacter korlensis]|uniref:Esterase/lipase family protein n=1 Tax=Lysobacter korlensis TaxID=553636 RepID=A0ABV6RSE3_9GAMM
MTGAKPTPAADARPRGASGKASGAGSDRGRDVRRVVLVHGLWMPAASMAWLGRQLARAGYAPERFGYSSVINGPDAAPALARLLARGPCHVLAHSLGGLLAVRTLREHPQLPVARVVCLGSPLCGSAAASGVSQLKGLGRLLGRSAPLLCSGCDPWDGAAELAVVAGRRPIGLGQLFGRFDGPSDGTVAVAETRLPGLADHIVIPSSHCGLLASAEAATLAAQFFGSGRFRPSAGAEHAPARGDAIR